MESKTLHVPLSVSLPGAAQLGDVGLPFAAIPHETLPGAEYDTPQDNLQFKTVQAKEDYGERFWHPGCQMAEIKP